jgi:hypothetical protein
VQNILEIRELNPNNRLPKAITSNLKIAFIDLNNILKFYHQIKKMKSSRSEDLGIARAFSCRIIFYVYIR